MAQLGSTTGKKIRDGWQSWLQAWSVPLGFGLAETLDSLRSARDCVTACNAIFGQLNVAAKPPVKCRMTRLLASLNKRPRAKRLHRASHMMIHALREA